VQFLPACTVLRAHLQLTVGVSIDHHAASVNLLCVQPGAVQIALHIHHIAVMSPACPLPQLAIVAVTTAPDSYTRLCYASGCSELHTAISCHLFLGCSQPVAAHAVATL
jgi:hypothetical protein